MIKTLKFYLRNLGQLDYIRIWHDNSGKGGMASWFLKTVIVHDLQTRECFYFICEKWLAVEKDDGCISRTIPVAGNSQKEEFKYMAKKRVEESLRDNHLWLSIFTKPLNSSFTRFERTLCCFLFLFICMVINIIYYGSASSGESGLSIGFINITRQQVKKIFLI